METVLLLLCYFYVYGMRRVVLMAKDSAGLYRQDCWFAVAEAIINIIMSLVFVLKFKSINGIIAANVLSMLIVPMWTQPYLVYKHVLKHKLPIYYVKWVLYAAVTVGEFALTYFVTQRVAVTDNIFVELIIRAVFCVLIPNGINLVVFIRTQEMRDMITLALGLLKKKKKAE